MLKTTIASVIICLFYACWAEASLTSPTSPLFKTDTPLVPGGAKGDFQPIEPLSINGNYYFVGVGPNGVGVYVTDGVTVKLAPGGLIAPQASPSSTTVLPDLVYVPQMNKIFFGADDGISGTEPWYYDLTTQKVVQISDIATGNNVPGTPQASYFAGADGSGYQFTPVPTNPNQIAFAAGLADATATSLFIWDQTTKQVTQIAGATVRDIAKMTAFGNTVIFGARITPDAAILPAQKRVMYLDTTTVPYTVKFAFGNTPSNNLFYMISNDAFGAAFLSMSLRPLKYFITMNDPATNTPWLYFASAQDNTATPRWQLFRSNDLTMAPIVLARWDAAAFPDVTNTQGAFPAAAGINWEKLVVNFGNVPRLVFTASDVNTVAYPSAAGLTTIGRELFYVQINNNAWGVDLAATPNQGAAGLGSLPMALAASSNVLWFFTGQTTATIPTQQLWGVDFSLANPNVARPRSASATGVNFLTPPASSKIFPLPNTDTVVFLARFNNGANNQYEIFSCSATNVGQAAFALNTPIRQTSFTLNNNLDLFVLTSIMPLTATSFMFFGSTLKNGIGGYNIYKCTISNNGCTLANGNLVVVGQIDPRARAPSVNQLVPFAPAFSAASTLAPFGFFALNSNDFSLGLALYSFSKTGAIAGPLASANPVIPSTGQLPSFSYGGLLYFSAQDPAVPGKSFVYTWDGQNTVKAIIGPGATGAAQAAWLSQAALFIGMNNNMVIFRANDPVNGNNLWASVNGNVAVQLQLINDLGGVGAAGSVPASLVLYNNAIYFSASQTTPNKVPACVNGANTFCGRELFKTDGTTVSLVKDFSANQQNSNPIALTVLGPYLYFVAKPDYDRLFYVDGNNAPAQMFDFFQPGQMPAIEILGGTSSGALFVRVQVPALTFKLYRFADPKAQPVELTIPGLSASSLLFPSNYPAARLFYFVNRVFDTTVTPNRWRSDFYAVDGTTTAATPVAKSWDLTSSPANTAGRQFRIFDERVFWSGDNLVRKQMIRLTSQTSTKRSNLDGSLPVQLCQGCDTLASGLGGLPAGSVVTDILDNNGFKLFVVDDGTMLGDVGGAASASGKLFAALANTPTVTPTGVITTLFNAPSPVIRFDRNGQDGWEVGWIVIQNPVNGVVLFSDGTPLPVGGVITMDKAKAGVIFVPSKDVAGTASFQVAAAVGINPGGWGAFATVFLSVGGLEGAPSITPGATSRNTRTSSGLVFSPSAINVQKNNIEKYYKIWNILNGQLFKRDLKNVNNGEPILLTDPSFITQEEGAAGLIFLPTPNFLGTASFTAQASFTPSDVGLGGSSTQGFITVRDIPAVTVSLDFAKMINA